MSVEEHAEVSPSGLKRLCGCTKSFQACKGEQVPSDQTAADEGTVAHAVAEGDLMGVEYEHPMITTEMIDYVKVYTDFCRSLMGGNHYYTEHQVKVKAIHATLCWGTLDFGAVNLPFLDIVDLKYGYRYVAPGEQFVAYACGLLAELSPSIRDQITHVRLHVVQPRGAQPGGAIRTLVLSIAELAIEAKRIKERVRIALSDEATLTAGPWCYKCPRVHDCPAAIAVNYNVIDWSMIPGDFETVDINILGRDLLMIKRAEDNLKDRKVRIEEVLTHHLKFKGSTATHTMEPALGNRAWKSEDRAAIAGELAGVDMHTKKLKSPAQAEKAGMCKKTVASMTNRKSYRKLQPINFENVKKGFKL